jgi:hypothetical protein
MIERLENFLSAALEQKICDVLCSDKFPWYFNDSIVNANSHVLTAFQFTHVFFKQEKGWVSSSSPLIQAMLQEACIKLGISVDQVVRIKANLMTLSGHGPDISNIHQDCTEEGSMSLLYYVNDSDGNTIILDKPRQYIVQQIPPKRNAAIFFDSRTWHSSCPPIRNKRRVVINTILKV